MRILSSIEREINIYYNNIKSFKNQISLQEYSGSFGDLDVLLPFLLDLSKRNLIYLPGAFFWGGFFNIVTAIQWNIPMPVQPMKAISSVALTDGLTYNEVISSGLITSAVVTLLGLTHTIYIVNRFIPKDVVSGMQLGLGLNMMKKGITTIKDTNTWLALDSYFSALLIGICTLFLFKFKKCPVALILFLSGFIVALIDVSSNPNISLEKGFNISNLEFSPINPIINNAYNLTTSDFYNGLIKGALPQIPLTILNSVISVGDLAMELFPNTNPPISKASISTSIGIMNTIGCLLGGMPMCHGAGGLAGQYRFGARGGFSMLVIGCEKIFIAIFLGKSLEQLLAIYPDVILGILLFFSGLQLAIVGIDKSSTKITVATAGIILSSNTWIGSLCGLLIYYIDKMSVNNNNCIKKLSLLPMTLIR